MEHEIITINDFFEVIFEVQKEINDFNNNWESNYHKEIVFRGQADQSYELIPSIGRNRKFSCEISILNQERNLIEMAKYKLPHIFKTDLPPINLLSLLQHYGIPTRLLDVTSSPLVALYFACLNDNNDGEVFIFEYNASDITNYPIINGIAESYKFAIDTMKPLSLFYKNIIEQPYFIEQKNIVSSESSESGIGWIRECCKELIFVNTTEWLERQKLQRGLYILFPNKILEYENKFYFEKKIAAIEKDNKQIKRRIIIKKDGKSDIREKLRFLGISEATLFSDNIDIVCKNIVEHCKRIKI